MTRIIMCPDCKRTIKHYAKGVCETCWEKSWRKTKNGKRCHERYMNSSKGKMVSKNIYLKRKYGISLKERDKIIKKQNGKCAICNDAMKLEKNKHVDHCHDTGKVRGVLCKSCNTGIGMLKDDVKILYKAIKYLRLWRED